jgi:hypothetical protein
MSISYSGSETGSAREGRRCDEELLDDEKQGRRTRLGLMERKHNTA